MPFTDFFIRRPTPPPLLITAIAGFGLLSYPSLPVSNLPEVEYPTIRVQAALPGANPDAMASTVATPLESEFSTIPGIEHMTSTSQVGESNIVLQFALNRGIDAAAQDVQAAISRAAGELPASMASPPSYSKVNPAQSPILWLEMSSKTMALDDLAKYANHIFAKRVSMVSGVSQVEVYGPEAPAIRVQVDPARLAAYSLDLEQLRTSLTSNSSNLPSGTLYGDNKDFSLQANSQLTTAGEFSQMVVAYRDGSPIRLDQRTAKRDPRCPQAAGVQHRRSCRQGKSRYRVFARLHAARCFFRQGRRRCRSRPGLRCGGEPHADPHHLSRGHGYLCIPRHGIFDTDCQCDHPGFHPGIVPGHAIARLFRGYVFDDGDYSLDRLHRRRRHCHDRKH